MYSAEIILASNYDLLAKNFVLGEIAKISFALVYVILCILKSALLTVTRTYICLWKKPVLNFSSNFISYLAQLFLCKKNHQSIFGGFPDDSVVKNLSASSAGDIGSIPALGRFLILQSN